MSDQYVKSNAEGARRLFNKRAMYTAEAMLPQTIGSTGMPAQAMVDFFAEKFLYGRVSRDFVPIAMTRSRQQRHLRAISAAQSQEKNLRAIHFVVDAFNAMATQFEKCAMEGKIDINDPFLSRLKAYRAFENPILKYQQYMTRYLALFKANVNSDPLKPLENFDQFENEITEAVRLTGLSSPITYTGFVKSRRCPINVSGLAIEIADLDASDDQGKVAQFLKSKNWDFFVSTAATYGFMIDVAVPWRLVADIGSSAMLEYAAARKMHHTDEILSLCYGPVSPAACGDFATQLYNMYNKSTPAVIVYAEECNGVALTKQRLPNKYASAEKLKESYRGNHFLSLYCKIRFEEEESTYTENERRLLIADVLEIARITNQARAISKFERILNKPFDYSGSLSYYVNWIEHSDAEKEAEAAAAQTWSAYGKIPREG
jgi:hypothetical protein